MKVKHYRSIIVALLILFGIYVAIDGHLDSINTQSFLDMCDLVDQMREEEDTKFEEWKTSYEELQLENFELSSELGRMMDENVRLQSELNVLEAGELPTYQYTREEINLLMKCVQAEAGNYSNHANSQEYVTQVILNRVANKNFPNTIKEVIYQKIGNTPQFSVAYNGMLDSAVVEEGTKNSVYQALMFGTDLPDYVLYFYSASLSESNWVHTLNVYDTVQGTVFAYSNSDKK